MYYHLWVTDRNDHCKCIHSQIQYLVGPNSLRVLVPPHIPQLLLSSFRGLTEFISEFAICHVAQHGNINGRIQKSYIVGLVTDEGFWTKFALPWRTTGQIANLLSLKISYKGKRLVFTLWWLIQKYTFGSQHILNVSVMNLAV